MSSAAWSLVMVAAGAAINTPKFSKLRWEFDISMKMAGEYLRNYAKPEDRNEESYKGYLNHKPLASLDYIRALEADGLVSPLTSEERAIINKPTSYGGPLPEAPPFDLTEKSVPPAKKFSSPLEEKSSGFPMVPVVLTSLVIIAGTSRILDSAKVISHIRSTRPNRQFSSPSFLEMATP